ncbi:N-alpha-acetyltransferase 60 [Oncorhynchus nerka]|uniref:N-alpha-acetyltransferase 60 n=1 Tax=Oncorhynchus nerka TaxID=8023 RepID=UPI0031B8728E
MLALHLACLYWALQSGSLGSIMLALHLAWTGSLGSIMLALHLALLIAVYNLSSLQDGDILASRFPVDTQVAYILSLGVVKEFRKHGIGSLLLDSLKEHISTTAQDHCKAIYLHVLTTNTTAIHFYHNRDFTQHHYLPYYYSIRGVLKDGFTYVLYINGGHPPWTLFDYIQHIGSALASLSPCSIPQRLYRQAQSLLRSLIPWSGIASKTGIQYSRTM